MLHEPVFGIGKLKPALVDRHWFPSSKTGSCGMGLYDLCVYANVFTCTEGDDDSRPTYDDYNYGVGRHSSITSLTRPSPSSSSSSSSSSPAGTVESGDVAGGRWRRARTWRWCYVCSGKSPDRQCERFPQHVTLGPAKVNCTKNFCTAYVRYKAKDYLVERDRNGKLGRLFSKVK